MKHLALIAALTAPTLAFANPDPADWDAVMDVNPVWIAALWMPFL